MSRSEAAIFTNMCMISDGNGNVLVQDRRDPDWPGITFPGGHVEPGEAFADSVIREVFAFPKSLHYRPHSSSVTSRFRRADWRQLPPGGSDWVLPHQQIL